VQATTGLRQLLCLVLVAVLAAACGGSSGSPPPPAPGVLRLSQGVYEIHEGIEVGVRKVLTKERKAPLSLTEVGRLGSMQQVELAVGEGKDVGSQRLVLVGVGKGAKKAYVDFRLQPLPGK
jgi:hypothetical protein